MKKILILAMLSALMSCEKIEGQLNISKELRLRNSDGVVKNLAIGTYSADLAANTKKKLTLRLNNNGDEKYIFNVPDGSIPQNGTFNYKSQVLGQPVDLSGTVATTITNSSRKQSFESCMYHTPVQVCFPTPNGGMTCTIQDRVVYGTKTTFYYDRTTNKDVTLSIAVAETTDEAAQFQGETTWIERIVTSETQCR